MAIDFPAAPAVNDEYSFEGRTWRWNGTGWEVKEYPAALLAGTAANPSLYFTGDPNTGLYSPGADQVALATGGASRLHVAADGKIGVGTSAPVTNFEIAPSASSAILRVHAASDTSPEPAIQLMRGASKTTWGSNTLIDYSITNVSGRLLLLQGETSVTTERLRINTLGRFIIGHTAEQIMGGGAIPRVQVMGNTGSNTSIGLHRFSTSANTANLFFTKSKSDTIGTQALLTAGDGIGTLDFQGSDGVKHLPAAQITGEVDGTPALDSMPGRLTFSTTANGAATSVERMRLTSSGYLRFATTNGLGIQFNGDTAAANALDDYEEGTWTVELFDASTAGNLSSTTATGHYVKIGAFVNASFSISSVSTAGLTAGNFLYFSLPFSSGSPGGSNGVGMGDTITYGPGSTALVSRCLNSAGRGFLVYYGSGVADGAIIVSNISSGVTDLSVNISYRAA
jgi:hypothetical protein